MAGYENDTRLQFGSFRAQIRTWLDGSKTHTLSRHINQSVLTLQACIKEGPRFPPLNSWPLTTKEIAMIQLDMSNAELVTLHTNDEDSEVEIRFCDCPNVIIRVNEEDTVVIDKQAGVQYLTIQEKA